MSEGQRLDTWLWVARLTKTRALAADLIKGGHVQVGGVAAKPAKAVGPGDVVTVRQGPVRREVVVRGTAPRRGPAAEAQQLYEETPESVAAREAAAEQRRLAPPPIPSGPRPTKRDRRRLDRWG